MQVLQLEEVFDAIFERDIAEGHCDPAFFDSITDELARCKNDAERDLSMKQILDKLFHQQSTISHQIHGLDGRPELNGNAVQVLGPMDELSISYPVKVMNLHAPFHGEMLRVRPQNLHILFDTGHPISDEDEEDGSEDGREESSSIHDTLSIRDTKISQGVQE